VVEHGSCSVYENSTHIETIIYEVGINIIGKMDESEDFVTRITSLEEECHPKKMDKAKLWTRFLQASEPAHVLG
jgi:hypothetical protein